MSTNDLRKNHEMSRKDAVRCNKTTKGDVAAYKGGQEYQERAKRRAKQGNGLGAKPRLANWTAEWAKSRKDKVDTNV